MAVFDLEQRWPELFEGLDEAQRASVVQPLANAWHEGWQPNRDDVALLVQRARGEIDAATALRRAMERVEGRADRA